MLEKSSDWQDCACGKQSADIPRRAHSKGFALRGQPKDKILATLGDDFFNTIIDLYDFHYDKTVFDRNRKKAIRIMNKIEERAAIVLAQELAKKKNK